MTNSPFFIIAIILLAALVFIALSEYFYLDITSLGKRKALRNFHQTALEMGFQRSEKRSSMDFGVYSGSYKGYLFSIAPDRQATVHMKMESVPGLQELHTSKGKTNFDSGHHIFDDCFKTRIASEDFKKYLSEIRGFTENASKFCKKWKNKCDYIQIYKDSIYCSLKYGNSSYIPASVLKEIVPDMAELGAELQQEHQGK